MIEAGLEFDGEIDHIVAAFMKLPALLRPIHFSHEEKVSSNADQLENQKRFAAFVAKSKSGFFLLGPLVTYSIRIASGRPLVCDCFIDVEPEIARQFMIHMSKAQPLFGFACAPGEREQRNRVTTQQGVNVIESWIGRDTQKYIPGFYWITLLPDAIAKLHAVPLSAVKDVALEHIQLMGGQHLFRFYDRPEEWRATSVVAGVASEFGKYRTLRKKNSQKSIYLPVVTRGSIVVRPPCVNYSN